MSAASWTILSVAQTDNYGQWKVVARKGSLVLHVGRLDAETAANFTAQDCAAAWAKQNGI